MVKPAYGRAVMIETDSTQSALGVCHSSTRAIDQHHDKLGAGQHMRARMFSLSCLAVDTSIGNQALNAVVITDAMETCR